MDYHGIHHQFYGYLIAFIADTPASALVGGFKEGVGGAHRAGVAVIAWTKQISFPLRYTKEQNYGLLTDHYSHFS